MNDDPVGGVVDPLVHRVQELRLLLNVVHPDSAENGEWVREHDVTQG